MNPESMKLVLAIEQRSKAIPYPPDEGDDYTNYGFQDLKSDTSAIQAIHEVQDCPAFRDALVAINAPETPFFTVGCEKSLNRHEEQYWKRGFLEFSFNYPEVVTNATSYFGLFFQFSQSTEVRDFLAEHSIHLCWELQQCRFKKIDESGFTCCVWITTNDHTTAAECEADWDEAVNHVARFVAAFRLTRLPPSPPIYAPPQH